MIHPVLPILRQSFLKTNRFAFSLPTWRYFASAFRRKTIDNLQTTDSLVKPQMMRVPKTKDAILPSLDEIRTSEPSLKEKDFFGVARLFSVVDLFNARVHFGHKVGTLDERMKPYLFGERLGVCIFDLDQTASLLQDALNFIAHIAFRKGIILFVTNERSQIHMVEDCAVKSGEYAYCRRWIDGVFADSSRRFRTEVRLPDLLIFTNTLTNSFEQHPAIKEAAMLLIPTVAIVDSNCNPNLITYPIPGNDDTHESVLCFLELFHRAIMEGKTKHSSHVAQESYR